MLKVMRYLILRETLVLTAAKINMDFNPPATPTGTNSCVLVNIPTVGVRLKPCLLAYAAASLANCLLT